MKKLMITLAAVAVAAGVQAASCSWETGGLEWNGDLLAKETASGSFWLVDSTTYGKFSSYTDGAALSLAILDASAGLGDPTIGPQLSAKNGKLTFDADGDLSYTVSTPYYAIVLYSTNQDGTDYYMGNVATFTADSDQFYTVGDMGKLIGGSGDAGAGTSYSTAWAAQSIPEPTSGLLLLLGMAGLALRRRRA